MTMLRSLFAMILLLTAGLSHAQPRQSPERRLAAIERASGGRLGVALIDGQGRTLMAHRANERFAMCSTFKLLLGGYILDNPAWLRIPLYYGRADLLPNSPFAVESLGNADSGDMRVGFAAEQIVTRSDNTAANLLLRHIGGPGELNAWLRQHGDPVTRLDRYETALNENRRGDPRDTTSPAAMARSASRLVIGDGLHEAHRRWLREWMLASRTGLNRIRAGLPAGWGVGDKTGTCGNAVNDVAFFRTPAGNEYILAVYIDRPRNIARGEAAIADVARLAAEVVQ